MTKTNKMKNRANKRTKNRTKNRTNKRINKSPKEVKRAKSSKKKGKMRNNITKGLKHSQNYINIDNIGSTKIIYTEGNKPPKKTVLKWDGNYDGKKADIQMNLDVDGKKRKTELKLTNDELMKILGANVVNKPIDERLQLLDEDVSKMYALSKPSAYPMMMSYQQQLMPQMIPLMSPQQMMPSQNVPVFIDEMPEEMSR